MSLIEDFKKDSLVFEASNIKILFPRKGGYTSVPLSLEGDRVRYHPPDGKDFKYLFRWWFRTALSRLYNGQKTYKELEKDSLMKNLMGTTEKQSAISIDIQYDNKQLSDIENYYTRLYQQIRKSLDVRNIKNDLKGLINAMNPRSKLRIRFVGSEITFQLDRTGKKLSYKIHILIQRGMLIDVSNLPRIILMSRFSKGYHELSTDEKSIDLLVDEVILRYLSLYYIPRELVIKSFKVYLNHQLGSNYREVLKDLIKLSLILGSVGSISNRGFGSIIYKPDNWDTITTDRISRLIKDLLMKVMGGNYSGSLNVNRAVPKVPTLDVPAASSEKDSAFYIYISERNYHMNDALKRIQGAYMINMNRYLPRNIYSRLVLGSPRRNMKERRMSSIASKIIYNYGSGSTNVLTYGFISLDIPRGNIGVIRKFKDCFEAVINYL